MDSTSIPFRSHTALLLAAALPYLQPAYRHPVELALKFLEFSETIKLYREFHLVDADSQGMSQRSGPQSSGDSGIFDFIYRFVLDPEGLLDNLSKVCNGKEKEIFSMLLNLFRAKSFYENYGDILKTFMSTDSFMNPMDSESPFTPDNTAPDNASPDSFSMPDVASMLAGGGLTSMLNEEQSDTLNLLKSLLESE